MLIDITLDEANLIEDALDLYIYSADSFISYDEL